MQVIKKNNLLLGLALCIIASTASAAIPADQIARLGQDLTPLGGTKAGNADGTIPAWTGGLTQPPPGYQPGQHLVDPFAGDQPLFTITADNMDQYAGKLSDGHQALLKTYKSFRMPVYPSRRTAAWPERIYDATRKTAATAKMTADGNGLTGAAIGVPFPIPANGQEVMWNHLTRFRGVRVSRTLGQATPTRNGDFTLVRLEDKTLLTYHAKDATPGNLDNKLGYFRQRIVSPARLAGSILLVHETLNQVVENRHAWVYNPGQRRVRRAPNVAYDNPGTASDGLRTSDQFDMFNGAMDRYDWKLVGKREMYVPYNAYKLEDGNLKPEDIIKPLHMNTDLLRYELHRVWVVEATLKKGASHIYKRRVFYVDEDSWQILLADNYDSRGQLWRVSEGHAVTFYDVPLVQMAVEVHMDLQAGRYLALGIDNPYSAPNFKDESISKRMFTPAALRRAGRR